MLTHCIPASGCVRSLSGHYSTARSVRQERNHCRATACARASRRMEKGQPSSLYSARRRGGPRQCDCRQSRPRPPARAVTAAIPETPHSHSPARSGCACRTPASAEEAAPRRPQGIPVAVERHPPAALCDHVDLVEERFLQHLDPGVLLPIVLDHVAAQGHLGQQGVGTGAGRVGLRYHAIILLPGETNGKANGKRVHGQPGLQPRTIGRAPAIGWSAAREPPQNESPPAGRGALP